jgi:ketosteroid isomerase-like protein
MGDRDEAAVEALQRAYEAFNRGDYDAVLKLARPDIQYTRTGIEAPLTGTEALRAWMEPDAFDRQRTEPLSFEVTATRSS